METVAYIILRLTFAWMFLYPLKALLADWDGSVNTVKLLISWQPQFFPYIKFRICNFSLWHHLTRICVPILFGIKMYNVSPFPGFIPLRWSPDFINSIERVCAWPAPLMGDHQPTQSMDLVM